MEKKRKKNIEVSKNFDFGNLKSRGKGKEKTKLKVRVKGLSIKEKITYFCNLFFKRSKVRTAIELEGGGEGGYALRALPK